MKISRINYLENLSNEDKNKLTYKDFSKTELTEIFNDICISDELKEFAELFFMKDMNIAQVADLKLINWQTAKNKYVLLNKEFTKYIKLQYNKK